MTNKKHYKLYKSGKNWCVMTIAALALTVSLTGVASADTTVDTAQAETSLAQSSASDATQIESTDAKIGESETNQSNQNNQQGNISTQQATDQKANSVTPKSTETSTPVKDGWVQESNGWTFYKNGKTDLGRTYSYLPTITSNGKGSGSNWYLTDNGVIQTGVQKWADTYYYFDPSTYLRVDNDYRQSQWGDWYMFGKDGRIATKVYQWAGTYYYFDPSTYLRVNNDYRQSQWGDWYLFGNDGRILSGVHRWAGSVYYFDPSTYLRVDNDWREGLYFGADGRLVNGGFSTRVINWFLQREGKITYSMYGSRTGADGTADCSGSMTMALRTAGASAPQISYSTESLHGYLRNNGYYLAYEGMGTPQLQYGDIIIWGHKAASLGGNGHTVVVTGTGDNPTVISTCYLTKGQRGTAIQEVGYDWYWHDHNTPYQYVYRLANQARN